MSKARTDASIIVAGVDEVGRGPLAGPVVASAVILPSKITVDGLADSKALTEKKRDALFEVINTHAVAVGIGQASHEEIDKINIHHASLLAMQRAIEQLPVKPEKIEVDGKFCPPFSGIAESIIGGDSQIESIMAASIIAKVTRDRIMYDCDGHYPEYGFAKHKGYPTKAHLAALREYGVCPIHRCSYKPVQRILVASGVGL